MTKTRVNGSSAFIIPVQNHTFLLQRFLTLRVHLLCDLERVRVGEVHVGWGDGQDQAALLGDELQQHVSNLVLDVMGLVAHGDLGHPGQVDEGQVQH